LRQISYPSRQWYEEHDCPFAADVPRDLEGNIEYRERALKVAREDPELAEELWIACSRDILFYINTFVWTFNPKGYSGSPVRPFITYPFQDKAIVEVEESIGVRDVAISKSRDMGATWICLVVFEWRWRFHEHQSFLVVSRNENYVDKSGDPKSLFWKLDFLQKHQPSWMSDKKEITRIKLHMHNDVNGSSIDGEATVSDLGRGDRRGAILLDERASIESGEEVEKATRDATNCRISNSTPKGRHGVGETFYNIIHNDYVHQLRLHWSDHPEKSSGLYRRQEDGSIDKLDADYDYADYPFVPVDATLCGAKYELRSPWFDHQCRRASSESEISQELEIDFLGSGSPFFATSILMKHEEECVIPPVLQGRIDYDKEKFEPQWNEADNGDMLLWVRPDAWGKLPFGREYIVGCDISAGVGGDYSSNSALIVLDRGSGAQVAEWASPHMLPQDFAQMTVAICKWFRNAYLIWEANGGPGEQYSKEIMRLRYGNIYYRHVEMVNYRKQTKKPGYWNSDRGQKILGELQRAMRASEIAIRSRATMRELPQYQFKDGEVVHIGSQVTDDQSSRGKAHGDRAIAMAVAWHGRSDIPVPMAEPKKEDDSNPPYGSMAWRFKEREREVAMTGEADYVW